jgi:hypothetical protein
MLLWSPQEARVELRTVLSCDKTSLACLSSSFFSLLHSDLFPETTIMFADLVGYVYKSLSFFYALVTNHRGEDEACFLP